MTTFDLSPLYKSTIGFDSLASIIDSAFNADRSSTGYPPYNIEVIGENQYTITLALSGFKQEDLDIETENGVLTIKGKKQEDANESKRQYLHKGIANRGFVRKFNLADHVEVTNAKLEDGLLEIHLIKEIPEVMKPRKININNVSDNTSTLNHSDTSSHNDYISSQETSTVS